MQINEHLSGRRRVVIKSVKSVLSYFALMSRCLYTLKLLTWPHISSLALFGLFRTLSFAVSKHVSGVHTASPLYFWLVYFAANLHHILIRQTPFHRTCNVGWGIFFFFQLCGVGYSRVPCLFSKRKLPCPFTKPCDVCVCMYFSTHAHICLYVCVLHFI